MEKLLEYKLIGFFLLCFGIVGCQKKDINNFDVDKSYLYIDIPYKLDNFGRETDERSDSIFYSFALDDLSVKDTVIKVVVKTMGIPMEIDRPYSIEVVEDNTTATADEWNCNILESRSIKAGSITDTIDIRVNRNEVLKERWMQIGLRLQPNDYFKTGYANLQEVKVTFSDILTPPTWWPSWQSVFGDFYREIYLKWIELYPLGADPTISTDNNEPYYWDNMPSSPVESWYPITFSYVRMLRTYFEENVVYPDGDESKPRIKIPYAY